MKKTTNIYLSPSAYAEIAQALGHVTDGEFRFVPSAHSTVYLNLDGICVWRNSLNSLTPQPHHPASFDRAVKEQDDRKSIRDTAVKPIRSRPLEMRQVAGKHYSDMSIEPIDYIMANDMCYNSGSVLKYISRFRRKNGLEDLYKAQAFLVFLISDVEKNPKKYGLDPSKTESQSEEYRTK